LTFTAFDIDDFENGVSQLQVLVNGHLVVDIPAGLNHLSGSGDFALYDNTWVNFGPFDITSFVVNGQNTITFMDPQTSDHFGLVRNVAITQGNTILLHVQRTRGVSPEFSFSYTFSIPPLVITSFTVSTNPTAGQATTFTVTFTGGTAPFRCFFRFGDGGSALITTSSNTCSAIHHFDDPGNFTVRVTVIGASTSDVQTARMTLTVAPDPPATAAASPVLVQLDETDD